MPKITINNLGAVRWAERLVRACARFVHDKVEHSIEIQLVPAPVVQCDDEMGFGAYWTEDLEPKIIIACGWRYWDTVHCRMDAEQFIAESFFHEFIHYCQWKNGKALHHTGVEEEAGRLVKAFWKSKQKGS